MCFLERKVEEVSREFLTKPRGQLVPGKYPANRRDDLALRSRKCSCDIQAFW
jgi:hypothetical protein